MAGDGDGPRIWTAASYFPLLRERMAGAGISQRALARRLGHTQPTQVCRWLGGQSGARAETLVRAEAAFQALLRERDGAQAPRSDRDPASGPSEPQGAALEGAGLDATADHSGHPSPS